MSRAWVVGAVVTSIISPLVTAQSLPLLVGLYPYGGESPSYDELAQEMVDMDAWLAANGSTTGLSLAGTFLSLENPNPAFNVTVQLDTFWIEGYIPFVNITSSHTVAEIANGSLDAMISGWADAYKAWIDRGGGRKGFLAPFPEMNGDWTPYYGDPQNFRRAFIRLQTIFRDRGVPDDAVSWVFVPNGWHNPDRPQDKFENYYPGDPVTDVVGFSAYNWGYCPTSWPDWEGFEEAFRPYLDRMRKMAPGKAIFIAQTATVKRGPTGDSDVLRDEWLMDTFGALANYPAVRAVLYFNKFYPDLTLSINQTLANCAPVDFRIFDGSTGTGADGIVSVMQLGQLDEWSSGDSRWGEFAFPISEPTAVFEDVWPAHPFSGQLDPYFLRDVERIYAAGVTGGCGSDAVTGGLLYCPKRVVTRAEMAVFLERGMRGAAFTPPPSSGLFDDVPINYWASAWIEQLAWDAITIGCSVSPPAFCPGSSVKRDQMAVFLVRSGAWPSSVVPAEATGSVFEDVDRSQWAADWIEELVAHGITGGCSSSPPLYCPDNGVTRGDMAVFLARTFDLTP